MVGKVSVGLCVRAGWLTTLVTCRAAGERESGVYECRDTDGLASDSITVNVAHRTDTSRGTTLQHGL